MASPLQRGPSTWRLRTDTEPDPVTGARRQVSRTFHGGKRDALKAQAAFEVEIRGIDHADTALTFSDLLDRWLAHSSTDVEERTNAAAKSRIDKYIRPALGDVPLCDLKPSQLDSFYRTPPLSLLKPTSIRRVHSTITSALNQALRWEWITRNPATLANPPTIHRTAPYVPPPAIVEAFLAHLRAAQPHLYVYVETLATLGARPGEVCALRWQDVDLPNLTVEINGSIARGYDRRRKDTKTHNVRRVSIDAFLARLLEKHRAESGMVGDDAAYVFSFAADHRVPWRPDSIATLLLRIRQSEGFLPVTQRSLRHYVATRLIAAGVDVRTVAGRLGHSNPAMTMNVYAGFLPEKDREAAEILRALRTDRDADE